MTLRHRSMCGRAQWRGAATDFAIGLEPEPASGIADEIATRIAILASGIGDFAASWPPGGDPDCTADPPVASVRPPE